MKKIFLYCSVLIIGLGCTKLEPEIYSDLTTSNAYSTESDVIAALTGIYGGLTPYPGDSYLYYAGYLIMITDYATDIGFSTAAGDPTALSNFSYDDNNRYFSTNWQNMYQIITNANTLLNKIEGVEIEQQKKEEIIGQARFLRALAYRDLTDAWGPVPLMLDLKDPTQTIDAPLSSVDRVDSLIIEDCKYAIDHLPKKWDDPKSAAKATKGAALALLGKVYMRKHDYVNAKIYIDQVLHLRDEGIYKLDSDFRNVWSGSNPMQSGMIFGVLHEPALNGAEIANHFGPSDNPVVTDRWQYYAVSLYFWRKYSDLDPRKEFFYYNYEGDAPRDGQTTHGFYYMMPAEGQNTPPNDTTKLLQNVATKKYTYQMIQNSYMDGRTIQIFRLSDIILCKAEIENALNGPSQALPWIDEIRRRAGAPEYGSQTDFPVPSSKEEMDQKILDERGFELVFEYQRREDLIRFGKWVETSNTYLASRGLPQVVRQEMALFPYPLREAKLNKEMAAANLQRLP